MSKTKIVIHPSADFPANWDVADAYAIQALAQGIATPEQQQRALNWIIYNACGTYDSDYRPNEREHAFVSGKRNVGLQLVKLTKVNTGKLTKE